MWNTKYFESAKIKYKFPVIIDKIQIFTKKKSNNKMIKMSSLKEILQIKKTKMYFISIKLANSFKKVIKAFYQNSNKTYANTNKSQFH